jgi:uncharacterized membrane-anchored protein YhcB (DUF1043 family)
MFKKIPIAVQWVVGVISAISLIGGIAWGMAVWVSNTNAKGAKTDKLETKMDGVQRALENQKKSQDSLKNIVIDYAKNQDALTKSYIKYVQDNTQFTKDFTKYMEGLSFELIQPEKSNEKSSVKPSAIIRVVPVKPIKK